VPWTVSAITGDALTWVGNEPSFDSIEMSSAFMAAGPEVGSSL
jgi:hypothetical protein